MSTLDKLLKQRLVAIVRNQSSDAIIQLACALHEGGISAIEITFNQGVSTNWANTAESIRKLSKDFENSIDVGAGTVVTLEQVRIAADAGAKFIISPNVDLKIIQETKRLGLVSIPGAMTPSEIMLAHNSGADIVKIFPASILGVEYIKALQGPLSHIKLLAVGGVTPENGAEFMRAGCIGLGIGGKLVNQEWIMARQWNKLTNLASKYVKAVT